MSKTILNGYVARLLSSTIRRPSMMSKRVVLHLGTHKTGTSFVQSALRANEETLRSHGVRPVVGAESNDFLDHVESERLRSDWMGDACDVIVFSNENFVLADNSERLVLARKLRDTLVEAGADVTTIFYVRPATEWLPSMWAQYVKIGSRNYGKMTLDEFIEDYGYGSVLEAIAAFRRQGPTVIRPYVRSLMKNQSILDDFLESIALDSLALSTDSVAAHVNQTPSRRQIELARAYNLNLPLGPDSRSHHVELLNSFLRARHYRDPAPSIAATVTRQQLQTISDRYSEAEARLTDGSVDSRDRLSEMLEAAPDTYLPTVPDDAIDQYLQNMLILSKLAGVRSRIDG